MATPRLVEDALFVLHRRPACGRPARRTPRSRSSPAGSTSRTDGGGSGRTGSAGRGTAGPCLRPAPTGPSPRDTRRPAGSAPGSPDAVRISRTNWSYGLFSCRLSRIQSWKAKVRALVGVLPPLVAQDRGPLVGEVVGVVGAVEQAVDRACRACSGRCRPGTARSRPSVGSRPAMSSVDAAQERRVVAHRRRRQAERLQLLEDQLVDEVLRRRQVVDRHAQRNRRAEHADLPLIAGHDRDAAGQLAGASPGR